MAEHGSSHGGSHGNIHGPLIPDSPPYPSSSGRKGGTGPSQGQEKSKVKKPSDEVLKADITNFKGIIEAVDADIKATQERWRENPPTPEKKKEEEQKLENKQRFRTSLENLAKLAEAGLPDPNKTWFQEKFPLLNKVYHGWYRMTDPLISERDIDRGGTYKLFKWIGETISLMRDAFLEGYYGANWKENTVKKYNGWKQEIKADPFYKEYEKQIAAKEKGVEQGKQPEPGARREAAQALADSGATPSAPAPPTSPPRPVGAPAAPTRA